MGDAIPGELFEQLQVDDRTGECSLEVLAPLLGVIEVQVFVFGGLLRVLALVEDCDDVELLGDLSLLLSE